MHSEKFPVIEIPTDELNSQNTLGIRYQEGTGTTFRLKIEMDGFRYYTSNRNKVVVDCYLPGSNGQWKTVHEYGEAQAPSSGNPPNTTEGEAPWEVVDEESE